MPRIVKESGTVEKVEYKKVDERKPNNVEYVKVELKRGQNKKGPLKEGPSTERSNTKRMTACGQEAWQWFGRVRKEAPTGFGLGFMGPHGCWVS